MSEVFFRYWVKKPMEGPPVLIGLKDFYFPGAKIEVPCSLFTFKNIGFIIMVLISDGNSGMAAHG